MFDIRGGIKFGLSFTFLIVLVIVFTPLAEFLNIGWLDFSGSKAGSQEDEESAPIQGAVAAPYVAPPVYEELRAGMSFEEAVELLGGPGKKKGSLAMPSGVERLLHEWRVEGETVKVTFNDGVLFEWSVAK